MSEVARNLIRGALDSLDSGRRLEMKRLENRIKATEEDLENLKGSFENITGKSWEKYGGS